MTDVAPGTTVVLGQPGSGKARTDLDAAIADGTLTGVAVDTLPRIAVADARSESSSSSPTAPPACRPSPLDGGAHGLAMVTGLDNPKLFATSGGPEKPSYDVIAVGGDPAKNGPTTRSGLGLQPLPAPGTWVAYDAASQMVHILGLAPGVTSDRRHRGRSTSSSRTATRSSPTRACPTGSRRAPGAPTSIPTTPRPTAQQILVFDDAGTMASIDAGSHAFAWRLPGVIAGALTAALLYLLTRILFRRRLVAALVGCS